MSEKPPKLSEFRFGIVVLFVIATANFFIVALPFFSGDYLFPGDTYRYWSLNYFTLITLRDHGTLPWWDPMMYNGFPLYYHFLSGWSNYLSPYYLPSLIFFKLLTLFVEVNVSQYIVFHRLIYIYSLNVLAVYLVSRQLVKDRRAPILACVLFSFSYFQTLNLHDFYAFEALTAPLFFLFGLVKYIKQRNAKSLFTLVLFSCLLLASLNNGHVMSAFFWCGIFTLLSLFIHRSILKDTWKLICQLLTNGYTRLVALGALAALITSLFASISPLVLNLNHVLKYRGGTVEYKKTNAITNHPIPIQKSQMWSTYSNWIPFFPPNQGYLRIAWHGTSYRYIGLVTLPLLLITLIFGFRNPWAHVCWLTYFLCNAVIIYTTQNLAYQALLDYFPLFQNIRNMKTIFPMGGASLLLMFTATIGLDLILQAKSKKNALMQKRTKNAQWGLYLIGTMGIVLFSIASTVSIPTEMFGFKYIGFFLTLFSLVLWTLLQLKEERKKRIAFAFLLVCTFSDLTLSLSHRFGLNDTSKDEIGNAVASLPNVERLRIPDGLKFGPTKHEAENLFPTNYVGVYHNPWAIMWGIKEWLVLATHPELHPLLPTWNPKTRRVTQYPSFRFFDGAFYLPFRSIENPQELSKQISTNHLYLHAPLKGSFSSTPMEGSIDIHSFEPNRVEMEVNATKDGYLLFLDNYDDYWKVWVDGESSPILRANFTFKAIAIKAGTHSVYWKYDPYPVKYAYLAFYVCFIFFTTLLGAPAMFAQTIAYPRNTRRKLSPLLNLQ